MLLSVSLPRDVNATPVDAATFGQIVALGSQVFYVHEDGLHGAELFHSDGTAGGTGMLKEIRPGAGGASITSLAAVNGALYFSANDGMNGDQLWRSDGTEAGTVRPFGTLTIVAPTGFTAGPGGSVFFFARDPGTSVPQLWVIDGGGQPHLLKTFAAGGTLTAPVMFNGALYFISGTTDVWRSDGTAAGTTLLKSVAGADPAVANLAATGNKLYFSANYGDLYVSDGTAAGTKVLSSLGNVPDALTGLGNFRGVGNTLFFTFNEDEGTGNELWSTDGTTAHRVKDINPGVFSSNPSSLVSYHNALYFVAMTSADGAELYTSDGTDAGTHVVLDLRVPGSSAPSNLAVAGDTLYFAATGLANGTLQPGVYTSDGTAGGTTLLRAFDGYGAFKPSGFAAAANGQVFFAAKDGPAGAELWSTTGTTASTHLVHDDYPVTSSSAPSFVGAVNGKLVYFADDGVRGIEPWVTDGTPAGTLLLKDVHAGPPGSGAGGGLATSRYVYFEASETFGGHQLWRSDGTPDGTVKLATFTDKVQPIAVIDDRPLFFVNRAGYYTSDGTPAGTVAVTGNAGQVAQYARLGNSFYGPGTDGLSGTELYRYDADPANPLNYIGTRVTDVNHGTASANPVGMTAVGGDAIYFFADDDATARNKLYKYTPAGGAVFVADALPGADDYVGGAIAASGGKLYFAPGTTAVDVWVSDGTPGGTHLAFDSAGASTQFYDLNGVLLFKADNRLYRTDGTAAGTFALGNLNPLAPAPNGAPRVARLGNFAYFGAVGAGDADASLWRTDGTAAGTAKADPLDVDAQIVAIGDVLYAAATDPFSGKEVWTFTNNVQPPPPLQVTASTFLPGKGAGAGITFRGNRPFADINNLPLGLTVTDRATGTPVPAGAIQRTFNGDGSVTFTFPGLPGGTLADGNYHAVLAAGSLTDAAGVTLSADAPLDFFTLTADADGDRSVGPGDFNILASHFGQSGQTWATGDFDGDGTVGPGDFNLLASRFGTTLAPPPPAVLAPAVTSPASATAAKASRATGLLTQAAPTRARSTIIHRRA